MSVSVGDMSHTATLTDPSPSTIRIVPVWSPMQQHRIQVTPSLLGSVPRPPPSCTCRIATARRRSRSDPTGEPGRPSSPTMGGLSSVEQDLARARSRCPRGVGPRNRVHCAVTWARSPSPWALRCVERGPGPDKAVGCQPEGEIEAASGLLQVTCNRLNERIVTQRRYIRDRLR